MWTTFREWCRESWVLFVAQVVIWANAALLALPSVIDLLGDPTLGAAVQQWMPTKYQAIWNIALAIIFAVARMVGKARGT